MVRKSGRVYFLTNFQSGHMIHCKQHIRDISTSNTTRTQLDLQRTIVTLLYTTIQDKAQYQNTAQPQTKHNTNIAKGTTDSRVEFSLPK